MRTFRLRVAEFVISTIALLGAWSAEAWAQNPTLSLSGQSVPVRSLSTVEAATTRPLRSTLGDVRETPSGKLIINDALAKQLLLFDRSMQTPTVLRDSVPGKDNSYGPRASYLLPYAGDSSLFVDLVARALLVLAPEGAFARAMALPNTADIALLMPGTSTDAKGRLIYRGSLPRKSAPVEGAPLAIEPPNDSVPLLRADFDARRVDTIARLKVIAADKQIVTGEGRGRRQETIINPLQSIDGWTVLSNGVIALVRGSDYHVEWIGSNDERAVTAKMPFAWRQVTDAEKERLIDSARTARAKLDSSLAASARASGRPQTRIEIRNGQDVEVVDQTTYVTSFVPLKEMSDYYPPLRSGAVRADLDNNLWILPTTTIASLNGELVYDVVNQKGELFERVRVPAGRSIAGFGRNGVVYLMYRKDGGWFIERTKILRPSTP